MDERFGPKTWGAWSAKLAAPYALLMLLSVGLSASGGHRAPFEAVLSMLALFPLAYGAIRTIEKKSGGLRLLSGAWGLMAGLSIAPLLASFHPEATAVSVLGWVMAPLAVAGLCLTVLHKEK